MKLLLLLFSVGGFVRLDEDVFSEFLDRGWSFIFRGRYRVLGG